MIVVIDFVLRSTGYEPDRANNSKGEVVVNDSTVYCQSHRTDRSIFSAEKIQDRWFNFYEPLQVGFWSVRDSIKLQFE